ncbi:MAG: phospholipase D-like domain-containing protein [Caldimonas sp.]
MNLASARRVLRIGLINAAVVFATGFAVLCVLNLSLGNKQIDAPLARHHSVTDPAFQRTVGAVLGPELVGGNRIRTLLNGDQIFPAMLGALRNARTSITFETYIYWSSTIGREFEVAFADAARRGVQVKVLVDWVGGELAESGLERMRVAGVEVRLYNPPRWNTLGRFNNRTHRKLMVVDGRIGFVGGVGIADDWRGHAQGPAHWRGTHFQVEGPVVAQLQSAFIDNWLQTTGEALDSEAFLPPLAAAGSAAAHVFDSSPRGGSKSMQLLYLISITAAERSIDLSAAYFVPDEVAIQSLVAAARRGVRVRILVPGRHMDSGVVRHASRAVWGPLLEAGVQIFEYRPTMFHCKVMVVDSAWVSLGSSNFDERSFSINDESNLNVYDPTFAAEQVAVFEHDLTRSQDVTLDDWRDRPWTERALDRAAGLIASQL